MFREALVIPVPRADGAPLVLADVCEQLGDLIRRHDLDPDDVVGLALRGAPGLTARVEAAAAALASLEGTPTAW